MLPLSSLLCSLALPRDRQQLVEKMQSAESILVLYDVQRLETLTHLDTFWLPLIEANAEVSTAVTLLLCADCW